VLADAGSAAGATAIVLLFVLLFAASLGAFAFSIVALIDIVKRPDWQWKIARQDKVLWLLLVVLVNLLAIPSCIYWFNIRKRLIAVEQAAATGHYGPGHLTYSGWEPSPLTAMSPSVIPPGWHPDPGGQSGWRWWDGRQWTGHVTDTDPPAPGSPGGTGGGPPPA
jgi:hypothetical protein